MTSSKSSTPQLPAQRFLDLDEVKLRGGYYTSASLATWMCEWAIESPSDSVLEPSCGDGAFLQSACRRLRTLGWDPDSGANVTGVEITADELEKAWSQLLEDQNGELTELVHQDFFEWWMSPARSEYDVVLGNPPFIRYQSFPEPHRSRAMSIMRDLGLRPNRLTNIWVPFVAAAVGALKTGGRLALVLPAELLQVTYASQLRTFLIDRFRTLHIVACNELLFDNAQQEVVLLLADGAQLSTKHGTHQVVVSQVSTRKELIEQSPATLASIAEPKEVRHDSEKWLKYFLDVKQIDLLRSLREAGDVGVLGSYASVDVGVVTGKNKFFVLNAEEVERWDLGDFVVPLVGRSAQIRGSVLTKAQWESLAVAEHRVFLLQLGRTPREDLPARALEYVQTGEAERFNLGYKCSIRTPWYFVPSVSVPDAFLFRQIHDFPRIVVNDAEATSTDTIHRVVAREDGDIRAIAASMYSSLTAASAEIEGRSYGGGVLELEPTEAERLLVPGSSGKAMPLEEIDRLVGAGRLEDALEANDRFLLRDGLGLSKSDCALLRSAWEHMRDRRHARRSSGRRTRTAVVGA